MKKLTLPLFALLFVVPATASAMVSQTVIEDCKKMYPIANNTINFVTENTGHDPRQFLIRRCINTARQALRTGQQIERQQIRDAARYDRSAANIMQLRTENENYIQDAIRRQNVKRGRFRSRTNLLNTEILFEGRQSRRSIIRQTEGLDRINAIRRNLRQSNLPDPCTSVRAIRQFNNPCRDYGSEAGTTN
jgi:hypothetical protein